MDVPEGSVDLNIRHTLATLSYRLGKVLRGTPQEFGDYAGGTRTPRQILAHIGDLMDWALSQVQGQEKWNPADPLPWSEETQRFFRAIHALDQHIAEHGLGKVSAGRLFQGAIADALTHTGQLAMLRRMAGVPMRGENYSRADIAAGRVGAEQTAPRQEFD
jgi:hypothetical protein